VSGKHATAAIMDLGTNTFHLLIVELIPKSRWKKIYSSRITVKLGEDGFHQGIIAPVPFRRGLNALKKFASTIERQQVSQVIAIGTSGLRSASNAADFIHQSVETTGISINVIDGELEAELIATGVLQTLDENTSPVLIMDIGGGSTEFIIADRSTIFWKQSFNIGAARLLQKISFEDPPTLKQIRATEKFILNEIQPLFRALEQFPVKELVGASGAFESFSRMITNSAGKKFKLPHNRMIKIPIPDYKRLHKQLMGSTLKERYEMKGLIKMRADMILPASISLNLVLREIDLISIRMSPHALKEGVAARLQSDIHL
jgi:exopolyphosphatase/guanosine-5'-triphosphate,3'-diphosphate pyrophosphatase